MCTLLKVGCSETPLGHYDALLVIKKQPLIFFLTTRRAKYPRGVLEHPIFNSVHNSLIPSERHQSQKLVACFFQQ